MELILWRHAEAETGGPGTPDAARELTEKGRRQARKMAEWLNRILPDDCRILSSPAMRTVQTVEALGRKFKTDRALATDASAEGILQAAGWPDAEGTVLVVGHQPTLGYVASLLVAGEEQEWHLRKGSICWIASKADDEGDMPYLKAVLGADLVNR
ncbi:SixA phosphatase family protein [Noviherbaspirillum denitrificans]|uniref:Histidine phosphatase family protein n=1 Tax=Noviherbaspirillum denitrificans TaxID=1968433 RepID=A0A254TIV3_9BURK|nr:histidine phosphatase family protein [Noviherbaspirillum denitrificans]OWW22559.1 histidine phosphatase family protein [Noviherbaspirillum denitrificans]